VPISLGRCPVENRKFSRLMQCVRDRSHLIIQNWTSIIGGCGTIIEYLAFTDDVFSVVYTYTYLQPDSAAEIHDFAYLISSCLGCIKCHNDTCLVRVYTAFTAAFCLLIMGSHCIIVVYSECFLTVNSVC